MIIASLYSKPVNKSIAFTHGQKNNGYSACTEYPLSRLPTPPDRCHNRNFWNYFLMSTRVKRGAVFAYYKLSLFVKHEFIFAEAFRMIFHAVCFRNGALYTAGVADGHAV